MREDTKGGIAAVPLLISGVLFVDNTAAAAVAPHQDSDR